MQRINKMKLQPNCIQALKLSVKESSCWKIFNFFFFSLIWTNSLSPVTSPQVSKGKQVLKGWAWIALSAGNVVLTHHWWGHWAQLAIWDNGEPLLGCLPLRITRVAQNLWDTGFKALKKVRNLGYLWLAAEIRGTAWHMPRQLFVLAQALPGRH